MATSPGGNSREGSGSRASEPRSAGPSGAKVTLTSGRRYTARIVAPVTCRKASIGPSFWRAIVVAVARPVRSAQTRLLPRPDAQFGPEAALIVFGDGLPLHLVA